VPVVNCTTLASHLRRATPLDVRDELVLVPQVDVRALAALPRRAGADGPLRVLLYGRPSVPRNLFETALRGLGLWMADRTDPRPVEVVSAGEAHAPVDLGAGVVLRPLGQLSWQAYEQELAQSHLGLSLMLSPHPSYPPLEMTAAGLVVVTNRHEGKDLSSLSPRVVSCEPTSFDVARALADAERRVAEAGDDGRAYDTSSLGRPLADVARALLARLAEAAPGAAAPAQAPGALTRQG
jgi:O-antigen biosynthesis protein